MVAELAVLISSRTLPAVIFPEKLQRHAFLPQFLEECGKAFVELMNELLSDQSVRNRGIFDPTAVAGLRHSLNSQEFMLVKQVYSLMVLELWFRTFVDKRV